MGSSCPNCKNFYDSVCRLATDLGIIEQVSYINDIKEMIKMGIMTSPALLIDGKVVLSGSSCSEAVIRDALVTYLKTGIKNETTNTTTTCSVCSVV